MKPIEINITLGITKELEQLLESMTVLPIFKSLVNKSGDSKLDEFDLDLYAGKDPLKKQPSQESVDAVKEFAAQHIDFKENKEPEHTKQPEEAKTEAPVVEETKEQPAEIKKVKAEDVRAAMEEARNRWEFGTPEPGETKGPNAEADPAIHKLLTKKFKEIANDIEEGKKPSELSEENRANFISSVAALGYADGKFEILPF